MSHTDYASLINTIIIKIILHTYLSKTGNTIISSSLSRPELVIDGIMGLGLKEDVL